MKRPAGMIILGLLCLFAGISGLLTVTNDKPVILFGILHVGKSSQLLRFGRNLFGLYLGYGLLKPLRSAWYLYLVAVWLGIVGVGLNLLRKAKLWELSIMIHARTEAIPGLVHMMVDTHYLVMVISALTGIYVYLNKPYFWSKTEL